MLKLKKFHKSARKIIKHPIFCLSLFIVLSAQIYFLLNIALSPDYNGRENSVRTALASESTSKPYLSVKKLKNFTSGDYSQAKIGEDYLSWIWYEDTGQHTSQGFGIQNWNIMLTNINTGEDKVLSKKGWESDFDGHKVVWIDLTTDQDQIKVYDVESGQTTTIPTGNYSHWWPAIRGNIVVWIDQRDCGGKSASNAGCTTGDIYAYNLLTQKETRVSSSGDAFHPRVYGDNIVWVDERSGHDRVYLYNLQTGIEEPLADTGQLQWDPDIYGDNVVWLEKVGYGEHVFLYNIPSKTKTQISFTNRELEGYPVIYENNVIWSGSYNQQMRAALFLYNIDTQTTDRLIDATWWSYPSVYDHNVSWINDLEGPSIGVIKYDSVPPQIDSITTDHLAGTFKNGEVIDFKINFSEPVDVKRSNLVPVLTLDDGDKSCEVISKTTTSYTCRYLVGLADNTANLNLAISGSLYDVAGNQAVTLTPVRSLSTKLAIDNILPTITRVTTPLTSGSYDPATQMKIFINFSEPVELSNAKAVMSDDSSCFLVVDSATSAHCSYITKEGFYVKKLSQLSVSGSILDKAGNSLQQSVNLVVTSDYKTLELIGMKKNVTPIPTPPLATLPTIRSGQTITAPPVTSPPVSPLASRPTFIAADRQAPMGTFSINNDASSTKSKIVSLSLSASDISPVIFRRVSSDKKKWSSWAPFNNRMNWNMTDKKYGGNTKKGYKYIYVQYKDGSGNVSSIITKKIRYR